MNVGKFFGTHLGHLGSRSPSYRSVTDLRFPHDKVITVHFLQNLDWYMPLVMFSVWLNFGGILSETFLLTNFFIKFQIRFWEWHFKVKSGICYISQPKMVWLPQNKKQTYRLNARPQMGSSGLILAMTLTLNFQGQIWNFLYLSQK